jgi:hypothetical protein
VDQQRDRLIGADGFEIESRPIGLGGFFSSVKSSFDLMRTSTTTWEPNITVIASEARQSRLYFAKSGLLRSRSQLRKRPAIDFAEHVFIATDAPRPY